MSDPTWKTIHTSDDRRILIDETGVYPPEIEATQDWYPTGRVEGVTLYRVTLDRYKIVSGYLVPIGYAEDWPHPVASYVPWFADDLEAISDSSGVPVEELRSELCSADALDLAQAYEAIAGHFGWHEFDQYPLTLDFAALDQRWDR